MEEELKGIGRRQALVPQALDSSLLLPKQCVKLKAGTRNPELGLLRARGHWCRHVRTIQRQYASDRYKARPAGGTVMSDRGVTKTVTEAKTTSVTTNDGENEPEVQVQTKLDESENLDEATSTGSVCDYRSSRARAMRYAWDGARRLEDSGEVLGEGDMGSLIRAGWSRVKAEQESAKCHLVSTVAHRRHVDEVASEIEDVA
ncbi:MAG TPA: hypothetical protein VGS04_01310 [Nitrososphaerales archaeon]|nr:hypothetical protein [Nitrososphaerales archaeon]